MSVKPLSSSRYEMKCFACLTNPSLVGFHLRSTLGQHADLAAAHDPWSFAVNANDAALEHSSTGRLSDVAFAKDKILYAAISV